MDIFEPRKHPVKEFQIRMRGNTLCSPHGDRATIKKKEVNGQGGGEDHWQKKQIGERTNERNSEVLERKSVEEAAHRPW